MGMRGREAGETVRLHEAEVTKVKDFIVSCPGKWVVR